MWVCAFMCTGMYVGSGVYVCRCVCVCVCAFMCTGVQLGSMSD